MAIFKFLDGDKGSVLFVFLRRTIACECLQVHLSGAATSSQKRMEGGGEST
jgi:hypothetical protein